MILNQDNVRAFFLQIMFLSQGHAKAFYFADPAEGNQRRAEGDGGKSFPGQTVSD